MWIREIDGKIRVIPRRLRIDVFGHLRIAHFEEVVDLGVQWDSTFNYENFILKLI